MILKILRLYGPLLKLLCLRPCHQTSQLRVHQYPKWFSPELQHQLKCLQTFHTLWKKYKHSPTSHNLDRLNYTEDQFQLNIDSTKSSYEANLIHGFANHNNSKIYGYIQSITVRDIIRFQNFSYCFVMS